MFSDLVTSTCPSSAGKTLPSDKQNYRMESGYENKNSSIELSGELCCTNNHFHWGNIIPDFFK